MKRPVFLSFFFLFTIYSFGQAQEIEKFSEMKPWKLNQHNFSLAADNDHYNQMSLNQLKSMAKNPNELNRDLSGFEEEVETYTGGVAVYYSVGLSPLDLSTGTYREDRELRIGIGLHSPKEAMVEYKNNDLDTSIVYCGLHGEITLEGAYLYKGSWGKRFRWYFGYGMNIGTSFANEVLIISGKYYEPDEHPSSQLEEEITTQSYKGKSVAYSRLYIPYGVHYAVNEQWQIGLDFRTGVGVQFVEGEKPNFINKTGVFAIGGQYRFR